ncbi:hypothetical protein DBR44_01210 [Aquitalea sp. FJL05]|uniref:AAA family ATPase n=1 Tax=Aquitalea sp. FJL05 TaxID=2153366 RepID=UPI000F5933D1|nr:AAA family ATPase [Aquitalea sp. FJL05]RQO78394.1 hypothetical protein DBR44_01210 [Aquitalea sp. FJL05]
MINIKFENLGPISSGEIELAPLTVICGRNNVGKTYVSHTIACCLEKSSIIVELLNSLRNSELGPDNDIVKHFGNTKYDCEKIIPDVKKIAQQRSRTLATKGLNDYFNIGGSLFKNLNIEITYKFELKNEIFSREISEIFESGSSVYKFQKPKNSFIFNITHIGVSQENDTSTYLFLFVILINIVNELFPTTTVITSERTGIALFYKALDTAMSDLGHEVSTKIRTTNRESIKHLTSSISDSFNFSTAIKDNINQIRQGENKKNALSDLFDDEMKQLLETISGGHFIESSNEISFKPKNGNTIIPMSATSSSVKSIYLIENFIKYISDDRSLVVIDEPELNLHLDNQIQMARVITKLVNSGVKVVITTHSDHLLRELNTLMMLSSNAIPSDEKLDIIEEFKIPAGCIINPEHVKAFVISAQERKLFPAEVNEYGINLDLFNREILKNNRRLREITGILSNYLSEKSDQE